MTKGIFKTAKEACDAAAKAQAELVRNYTYEDRDRFIQVIKKRGMENMEKLAQMEFDETGYGRFEDKIGKNTGAVLFAPGTDVLPRGIYASDKGLTVEYYAPFGVVGAVTPVTNPAATIFGNGLANIVAGNAVVFNCHPGAIKTSNFTIGLINEAIVEAGGPENLLVAPENSTMETLDEMMNHPAVKLLVGTGGPGMVKTLMASGKKVIAAGAGNPPSIIDATANLKKAAQGLIGSASFDNNLLCVAEKEVFVLDEVFDKFIAELKALGVVVLTKEEAEKVKNKILVPDPKGFYSAYAPNKNYVGKCANVILRDCGIECDSDPRIAIYETDFDDPLIHTEQLMPIIPFVRCKDFDQALGWAVKAENGRGHSASIWSQDIDHVTKFGTLINTTIFVQNGGTMAAFGLGGSGTNSPTIATPTGEGVTGPANFTRRRRFCMADGGNWLL